MTKPVNNKLPLPSNFLNDQQQFVDLYIKLVILLDSFENKLGEVQDELEPLKKLSLIVGDQLSDAGIKLSDVDSLISRNFSDVKQKNDDWKLEIRNLMDSLKSANSKLWTLITVLVISIGLGIFNLVSTNVNEKVVEQHYYHLPTENWTYSPEHRMVFCVVDGDTIFKKI